MITGPAIPHNAYFRIRGIVHKFDRALPDGKLQFLAYDSGAALIIGADEHLQGWRDRTIIQCDQPDPTSKTALLSRASLTEHDREVVDRKLRYVLPVEKARKEGGIRLVEADLVPIVRQVAEEMGDANAPHYKTVALWYRKIAKTDFADSEVLRDHYRKPGPPLRRLDTWVAEIIDQAICEVYLNRQEYDVQAVFDAVIAEIGRRNDGLPPEDHLIPPHRTTVYRWISQIDGYVAKRFREGKQEADAAYKTVYAGPKAFAPNDVWEIDHHKFKSMLISTSGIPIGRPWLTTALDRCTRVPVGYYISFDAPSTHSIMMCLRNAIMPKVDLRKRFPVVENDCPYYGRPKTIVVDNGADFHSAHFKAACRALMIHLEYAPVRRPEWKARVERFFGTMARRYCARMPGTTKPRSRKLKQHNPADDAAITIDAFEELLNQFLLDDYCQSPHRGLGNTPHRAWLESGFRPQLPANVENLDVLLMNVEERVLGHDGINYKRLKYGSQAATRIRAAAGEARIKVRIKSDPTDLGKILVENPETKELIVVPCLAPQYARGLSLFEHKALLAAADENLKEKVDIVKLCTKRDEMRRLMASALKRGGTIREMTNAARWLALSRKGFLVNVVRESGLTGDQLDELEILPDDPEEVTEAPAAAAPKAPARSPRRSAGGFNRPIIVVEADAVEAPTPPAAAAPESPAPEDSVPDQGVSHGNTDESDLESLFSDRVENFTGKIEENGQ